MIAIWIAVVLIGLYGVDRLGCWMEARGWLYWRKKHGSSGALGAAFLEVQSLFEPSKRYVIEARSDEDAEDDDSGDPPKPGHGGQG